MEVRIGVLVKIRGAIAGCLTVKDGTCVGLLVPDPPNSSGFLLEDLIKGLKIEGIPKIRIRQALLAEVNGDVLAAVSLKLDIDLKELPLVGQILRDFFPKDPLQVDSLQFLVASKALNAASIAKIKKLIPKSSKETKSQPSKRSERRAEVDPPIFELPEEVRDTFDVTGVVRLGKFKFPAEDSSSNATTPSTVDAADHAKWINLSKTFGPVTLRRLGMKLVSESPQARAILEASFRIPPLTFSLEGLSVGVAFANIASPKPEFLLSGAGVTADSGPIAVSGALVTVPAKNVGDPLQIDGSLLVRTAGFTVSALASYVQAPSGPSIFAFAVLKKDLGGPPSFHVEGLALGLGINRKLLIPDIGGVAEFPLVKAAFAEPSESTAILKTLPRILPVAHGNFWVAAGVLFSSYKMLQSFALLAVSIGDEVEIALLGISTLTVPVGKKRGEKEMLAFAELALRVVIRPTQGSVEVEGRLTDNCYVFDPSCTIRGGFAFCAWFSGGHAGDFVVTLGGYHPRFVRPAHYPEVPRLALNWQVDPRLNVSGEMYYAITPSCLMAGGRISAVYRLGSIEAWFIVFADFLIAWQPFRYDVQMGISPKRSKTRLPALPESYLIAAALKKSIGQYCLVTPKRRPTG
jgi:hypothetical protein